MNIVTANRLVQYRKNRGLSQEELAAALGISRQAISKWERAEASPDTDNLISLARLYGVSLDELLLSEADPMEAQSAAAQPGASFGFAEPPAAPDPALVVETQVLNQVNHALETERYTAEPPRQGERPPLSNAARTVLRLGITLVSIVVFFIFCFFAWLFPTLQDIYPVLCTIVYLGIGFLFGKWHPSWMIFLTIPLFYMF